jgi:hypothetical protein
MLILRTGEKRGCAQICPSGEMKTGKGKRYVDLVYCGTPTDTDTDTNTNRGVSSQPIVMVVLFSTALRY